ncbi:O-antigen polymerase [Salinicoccus carnicancri]|uniref:O-antigen polymerase n=1 Tax=Salinicoccus carnicancri TaxID=558170 RepID=UPI0002D58D92|nr:O-antigen polymerase [Salinicoccus carnicancri]
MSYLIILVSLILITIISAVNFYLLPPLVFSIASVLIALYYRSKFQTWLNLYTLISFVYIMGFCVRFITLMFGYNQFNIPKNNMIISLIFSFLIYLIFIFGGILGDKITTRTDIKILNITKTEKNIILALNFIISYGSVLILFVLFGGWNGLVSSFSEKTNEFSGLGIVFTFIPSFSVAIILLLCVKAMNFNFYTFFFFLFSLLPLFTVGGRILFFLVLLSLLLVYEIRRKPINFRQFLTFCFLGFIFFISYFAYFRSFSRFGSWEHFKANWFDLLYNTVINGALSFIDGLNVIMYYVPNSVDYLGGFSILSSLLIFIPSILIPYKPDNTALIYNEIFNKSQYISGTGQNPSLIGEIYWNVGSLNTVLLFFFLGILIGLLYKKVLETNYNSQYLSVITMMFLLPIFLFLIKSGISTGTPYRIIFPLIINLMLLVSFNKIRLIKSSN